jgi:hypothetical protein
MAAIWESTLLVPYCFTEYGYYSHYDRSNIAIASTQFCPDDESERLKIVSQLVQHLFDRLCSVLKTSSRRAIVFMGR